LPTIIDQSCHHLVTWYDLNPVPDLRDTHTRNRRQKMELIYGASFWSVSRGL